ncbi:MAG: PhzF family phenazine biosynthesis protein [Solirubrobacterales bacterium]
MATLHVLRVFADEAGGYGNPLGVFLDGFEVPASRRQAIAHELGFSETVYVDDPSRGRCRIFTPGLELPFAGHPTVGTAWLLGERGDPVEQLRPPAGVVDVRRDGDLTFVAAKAEWSPPWELIEMESASAVAELTEPPEGSGELPFCWAWADEDAGRVRARCWSLEDGIGEDEATGSAAIMLAVALERPLTIDQGEGSLLLAAPLSEARAEVGGRVVLEEARELTI